MNFSLPVALFLLLAGSALAIYSDVQLDRQGLREVDGDIVFEWVALSEDGLAHYVIERRTPFSRDQRFEEIAQIAPHGPGKAYQFRDTQVYKSMADRIEYRLTAVQKDGVRTSFSIQSINYTPTAVRRTWGSIKAMFQ